MKIYQKLGNAMLSVMAFTFVAAAGEIVKSGSFFLFGEPKCPKCLLK
jgi:cyclic lactone autoinducer peptide